MIRRLAEGAPEPLGATLDDDGVNIAVYSAHAEAIELCLFDESGEIEIERLRLPFRTGDVFHAHVNGVTKGARYGLRAHGPFDPHRGYRFNPAKLLVDPYAFALDRPFALHKEMFAYCEGDPSLDLSIDRADSAAVVPKAIVAAPERAGMASRPRTQWRDTLIYELHVRGFTKRLSNVPQELRGTFAGLAHDAAIAHFVRLGVTTLELMPCAAWIDERHLAKIGLSNYWGYNPIAMMAPDPRLAPGGWPEVCAAVRKLHLAGLEVIIDVVLNHTGEADALGPTLSLRGLDNSTYYRLRQDDNRHYVNDAGCGNVLALDRAPVVRYAMDALRAWAIYGGVDGFRFDLATTLGRGESGFDPHAPLLCAIAQDPLLRELKLIAEPWDIGPGGYRLGEFPAPWGEWNDRFRDTARRFWRGDEIGVSELATRISGSSDFFSQRGRPSRSVNFIVAHDGFTLADLVSYERKHNEANGEDNLDGANENYSWNNGAEGESREPRVIDARKRDQRALLATLLLARGTPMLPMGAELAHSQGGNNNAYAQDNDAAWIDWEHADKELAAFAARLIALRKEHGALTRDHFLTGEAIDQTLIPDVEWLRPDGAPMREDDWRDGSAATLIATLYAPADHRRSADRIAIIWHRGEDEIAVVLPEAREGFHWTVCLDTARESGDAAQKDAVANYAVAPRSVVMLSETRAAADRRDTAISGQALQALAQAAGVSTQWRDIAGAAHDVARETIQALLESLGFPAQTFAQGRESLARLAERLDRRAAPCAATAHENEEIVLRLAAREGRLPSGLIVAREDGSEEGVRLGAGDLQLTRWRGVDGREVEGALARLPRQPLGRHRIVVDGAPDAVCRLTVAPKRCFLPRATLERRIFGISAQLYSLRRSGDQGVGDFTALSQLSQLAAAHGAALVAINPLHALFSQMRERASPYFPSDRRFLDPLYIDVNGCRNLIEGTGLNEAPSAKEPSFDALASARDVDYPKVYDIKRRALERIFADFEEAAQRRDFESASAFNHFIDEGGDALQRFACFEAISEMRKESWRDWPEALRAARPEALQNFARQEKPRIRFHMFLQWLCERQLERAAREAEPAGLALGLCRDLAVGAAPDGAEVWSAADRFIEGFSIGAPPDSFARDGQNWGLAPPNPLAWREDGCASFAQLLAANMRHAGALRIDHVMGLARLFVAPNGAKASEGTYVDFPLDQLLAQMALESERAKCFVVGEDLGTVPWGLRERLAEADVMSYRVLWFEREDGSFAPPSHYAQKAMACVSTHDLPTLAGWWEGDDILERASLGLLSQEDAKAAATARLREKRELLAALRAEGLIGDNRDAGEPFDDALAAAMHSYVARSPSWLAMLQLDDLAGEIRAVNMLGTDRERPNWRRKLPWETRNIFENPRAAAILGAVRRNLVPISGAKSNPTMYSGVNFE